MQPEHLKQTTNLYRFASRNEMAQGRLSCGRAGKAQDSFSFQSASRHYRSKAGEFSGLTEVQSARLPSPINNLSNERIIKRSGWTFCQHRFGVDYDEQKESAHY